jgi:N-acetyl-anhydromuramyl-L-alanine amidase AmpD
MIEIKTQLLPINTKRRSGKRIDKVVFFVDHDTGGGGSTAQNNVTYFNRTANELEASAHIFIDDKEAIMCVPCLEKPEKAWHVWYSKTKDNQLYGDDANDIAIGLELCHFPNDYERNMNAYNNYIEVAAYLAKFHGVDPSKRSGHFEIDPERKVDPNTALKRIGKTYEDMKKDIVNKYNELYNKPVEPKQPVYPTLKLGDKSDEVKKLQQRLNIHGAKLVCDGDFGNKTLQAVKVFQESKKLEADGIVGKITWGELMKNPVVQPQPTQPTPIKKYEILKPNSYTTVVKIARKYIDNIDVVQANGKVELMSSFYNRTKASFLINGGLYVYGTGASINLLVNEGKSVTAGNYSKYGLKTYKDKTYEFGIYKYTPELKDMLGGSPMLVIDGKINIDVNMGKSITDTNPRSAIGYDNTYLYLVTIDGRRLGKLGATMQQLAEFMLKLGCTFGMNLDGGGSVRMLEKDKVLNSPTENRAVANTIAVYLK